MSVVIELVILECTVVFLVKKVYFLPTGLIISYDNFFFFFIKYLSDPSFEFSDLIKLFLLLVYLQEMMKVLYMEDALANLKDTDISPGMVNGLCYTFLSFHLLL